MPIISATCSVPVLASLLALPALAVVLARPSEADAYAVIGAVMAAIMALIEASKTDRTTANRLSVFLGSMAGGAFGPGFLFAFLRWRGWLSPESQAAMTWHVWAVLGLVMGLCGWATLQTIHSLGSKRIPRLITTLWDKLVSSNSTDRTH